MQSAFLAGTICMFEMAIAAAPQTAESSELFRRAKDAIEVNCADCYRGTKAELLRGIADLRKAIELGYEDEAQAYKLLAEGYRSLAAGYADSADEKAEAREALLKTYQKLVKLRPEAPDILYQYANMLAPEDRREAYQRVLRVAPEHIPARFAIGLELVEQGEIDAGLEVLQSVLADVDIRELEQYGRVSVTALRAASYEAAAKSLEKIVDARRSKQPEE